MASMTAWERRHIEIDRSINLIKQHRTAEAISSLEAFDKQWCQAPERKPKKESPDSTD